MIKTAHSMSKCDELALEQGHLHEIATIIASLRYLQTQHKDILKQEGVRKELQQLEQWLDSERQGPAPAGVITESGLMWLTSLRDQLRLSVEEIQRIESEGGNPSSREQGDKAEEVLEAVRRIDRIIDESSLAKSH